METAGTPGWHVQVSFAVGPDEDAEEVAERKAEEVRARLAKAGVHVELVDWQDLDDDLMEIQLEGIEP